MTRLRGVAGALVLALASALWVGPAAAGGGSETCSTVVVDEAGVLGDQRSVVETAARALGQLGAEVRVRALERVPGGDIDGWMRAEEQRCPGWLGVGGLRTTNLLVVAVATEDRKTGLWYGERWRPALDGRWQALQVDFMNPLFKQGEFGAGLAAGLGAMAGEIASPATSGGPLRGTTTTVFRDAVRRPDYVAEPEYGVPSESDYPDGYGEPGWGGGGDGSGVPAGFVAVMVVMGVLGLGSAVLRAGGSNASGSRWWGGGGSNQMFGMHGMHGSGGDSHSSPPSSSGGGSFGSFSSGGGGGGGGGGGSTSW